MNLIIPLAVGQTATVINFMISIIQHTTVLVLVIILVQAMLNVNISVTWSSVTRRLHSSTWPILLSTDSAAKEPGSSTYFFSWMAIITPIIIFITGIITPLGLRDGPILSEGPFTISASYVPDTTSIGRNTAPRGDYRHFRDCFNLNEPGFCPITPFLVQAFTSTPYGPFSMQFRKFYSSLNETYTALNGVLVNLQSFIGRSDIFAIEGLIVDLRDTPGIGFWNHTIPNLHAGGSWSEDVLWLEPVSSCVNTNISIDYELEYLPTDPHLGFNYTDRGGLASVPPETSVQGQDFSTHDYAQNVAREFIRLTLLFNNLTRNDSYVGKTFAPADHTLYDLGASEISSTPVFPLFFRGSNTINVDNHDLCPDFLPNNTLFKFTCSILLGIPKRLDGGDTRVKEDSYWTQPIYICAATTRARIQMIDFSFNGTEISLNRLSISRKSVDTPILWAMEKVNAKMGQASPLWGPVDDSYENDPAFSTFRSDVFYVPDSGSEGGFYPYWTPSALPSNLWIKLGTSYLNSEIDHYAFFDRWQSVVEKDPINGPSHMLNLRWTEFIANNLVGNHTATTVSAIRNVPSVDFDLRYGIPIFLLILIWIPTLLVTVILIILGKIKLSHIRITLNQTSVGRIVVGDSVLRVVALNEADMVSDAKFKNYFAENTHMKTKYWTKSAGETLISFGPNEVMGAENQSNLEGSGVEGVTSESGEILVLRRRKLREAITGLTIQSQESKEKS